MLQALSRSVSEEPHSTHGIERLPRAALTINAFRFRPVAKATVEPDEDGVIPPRGVLLDLVVTKDKVPSSAATRGQGRHRSLTHQYNKAGAACTC